MNNKTPLFRALMKSLSDYPALRRLYLTLKGVGFSEKHWARVVMDRETKEIVNSLSPGHLATLEISGSSWSQIPFKGYKALHYPDFDICESILEETFDLIIAEQVFEHLLWPYRAGRNVYKMLNQNGCFLVTTPFLVRVHDEPTDCSRWTEMGIKYFLAECGFDVKRIQTGSWGNGACVRANFFKWVEYRPWFHSLKNDPAFPVVVWALARK